MQNLLSRRLSVGFSEQYPAERNEETTEEIQGTVFTDNQSDSFTDSILAELHTLKSLYHITHPQTTGVYLKTWRRVIT